MPVRLPDSLAQSRGIYDLSRINAVRGPVYNRLDVELERQFKLANGELVIQAVQRTYSIVAICWATFGCRIAHQTNPCRNAQGLPIEKVDQMGRFPIFSARYQF